MRLLFRWVHMQAITSGRVLRIRAEMFKIKRVNRNIKKILVHILVALFVIFLIHPGRFSTLSMNIVSQDIVKLFAKKFSKSKDPLYSCSHALCSPKNSGIEESFSIYSLKIDNYQNQLRWSQWLFPTATEKVSFTHFFLTCTHSWSTRVSTSPSSWLNRWTRPSSTEQSCSMWDFTRQTNSSLSATVSSSMTWIYFRWTRRIFTFVWTSLGTCKLLNVKKYFMNAW